MINDTSQVGERESYKLCLEDSKLDGAARFKLILQARPKLACACCERFVQAEAPSRPIKRDVAADCLYLWRRRDLFEEQARNHGVGALGRVGHKDLHMA